MKTYDIHFNNATASNCKGFEASLNEAMAYINNNNGTKNSYFRDFKGGIVSIVCNQTGVTVFEDIVK